MQEHIRKQPKDDFEYDQMILKEYFVCLQESVIMIIYYRKDTLIFGGC